MPESGRSRRRESGTRLTSKKMAGYYDPTERKTTFNLQAHADVRIVAALYEYFAERGFTQPSFSALVNVALGTLHDVLAKHGDLMPIEAPSEAVDKLTQAGFSMQQMKEPSRARRLIKHLTAEGQMGGWGVDRHAFEEALDGNIPKDAAFTPVQFGNDERCMEIARTCLSTGVELPAEAIAKVRDIERRRGIPPTASLLRELPQSGALPTAAPVPTTTWMDAEEAACVPIVPPTAKKWDEVAGDELSPERVASQQASDVEQARKLREFSEMLVAQRKASEAPTEEEP